MNELTDMKKLANAEEDEEDESDSLMVLMEQIKNAKDAGKTMSDEERRANAENIMNKLAKMMDLGEEEVFDGGDYGEEDDGLL